MDITWFKDLRELSVTGNFSQAAQHRNISQPAFSRRIKALEAWVGTKLVDRTRHPVMLTSAGEQMLEASEQALDRLEYERLQIIEAQAVPDKYIVTFGTQHSIGWRFFPAWLQAFEEAYGAIISRLRADDLPSCMEAIHKREIDFVIAYESTITESEREFPAIESIPIGKDTLVPVCRPNAEQKPMFEFGTKKEPKIPWLRFGESAPITRHIDPLLEAEDISDRLSVVYENTMAGALRIRARDGAGVAWLPHSLVAPDLDAGLLVITGNPNWIINLEIKLYRNKEHHNAVTRKIWSFLKARRDISLI